MYTLKARKAAFYKEIGLELMINLFIAVTIVVALSPHKFTSLEGLQTVWDDVLYSFVLCLGLGYGNGALNDLLDRHYSWIQYPVRRLFFNLLVLLCYSFLFSLLVAYVYIQIFFQEAVFSLTYEDYISQTYIPLAIATVITAFLTSRGFLLGWRQSAIEAEKLKRAQISSRYESLKNQVNPHFLFNSLNALTNLVYEDQDQAALFIRKLADVYRYVLEQQDKEVVSLREELAFCRAYIFLQKIRFEDNLQVDIELTDREDMVLPPLSLQMLIENAIKHNEISASHPLHICMVINEDELVVKNKLQPKQTGEYSSGLGLSNITSRFEHLTDRKVQVQQSAEYFVVKLPLLKFANA